MPPYRTAIAAALLVVPIVAGGFLLQEPPVRASAGLFDQVRQLVQHRYVDSVAAHSLAEKAARGLVNELNDPYSELMSPRESDDFSRGTNGRYGGTGMYLGIDEQERVPVVDRVFPHTPAEDAGVTEGDRIVSIDGTATRGLPLETVSAMLRGVPGTVVTVTYARAGVSGPIVRKLTRREVHIPAVPFSTVLAGGVGYIPLQTFNENATEEVEAAVRSMLGRGARSLILDLRDNPGGIVEQALDIASLFLERGQEILEVRGRDARPEVATAAGRRIAPDIPLIVLVDGGSASASEIVAGALQDHDRALVLGTTTYGKGLVQSVYPLRDGYSLKITTGKWFTPAGRSIHRDRTPLADGRQVDVIPDSLEQDSVRRARPAFRSDAGRTIYGGGGITPDVIVPSDTLSSGEQQFLRAIASRGSTVTAVLRDYALELKPGVRAGFVLDAAWIPELERRLAAAGVIIDTAHRTDALRLLGRELESRLARRALGDAAAFERNAHEDAQLTRAITILRQSRTTSDVFRQ